MPLVTRLPTAPTRVFKTNFGVMPLVQESKGYVSLTVNEPPLTLTVTVPPDEIPDEIAVAAIIGVTVLLTLLKPSVAPELVPKASALGVYCAALPLTMSVAPLATLMGPPPVTPP